MDGPLDSWITSRDAAVELGLKQRQVQFLINVGRLPARKFGKDWVINKKDLELVRDRPILRRRLTPEEKEEINIGRSMGESVEDLAKRYRVDPATIYRNLK